MSDSATGSSQQPQEELPEQGSPEVAEPDEVPEEMWSIPDESLTLATLVATRDALLRQADDCTQLLRIYDRAIANWTDPRRRVLLLPRRLQPLPHGNAGPLPALSSRAAKFLPWPPRQLDQPSIIVVMDPPGKDTTSPAQAPSPAIESVHTRPVPSRELATETIRFAVVPPNRSVNLMWMVAIGIVLAGLTTGVWLGVSSAASGQSRDSTQAVQSIPAAAEVSWSPRVKPFQTSVAGGALAPDVESTPGVVGALPKVSISRFNLLWGDTSVRQLRGAVRRAISKMKSCFAQSPHDALALPDTLSVSLRLRQNGRVKWLRGVSGHGGSMAAEHCIQSGFLATTFPLSKAGLVLDTELLFQPR